MLIVNSTIAYFSINRDHIISRQIKRERNKALSDHTSLNTADFHCRVSHQSLCKVAEALFQLKSCK